MDVRARKGMADFIARSSPLIGMYYSRQVKDICSITFYRSASGNLGRAFLLSRKSGLPFGEIIPTIVIERTVDLAFSAAFLLAALPFVVQCRGRSADRYHRWRNCVHWACDDVYPCPQQSMGTGSLP